MRIAASTILACSFTLINAERAETGEEVPLMQATHLSEVSLEAEADLDDGVSEGWGWRSPDPTSFLPDQRPGNDPAATRHSAPRQRQRQHKPRVFVEELDHRHALYAEQVANARMLLEDKDLALSPEQQDVIKAMHSPNHVRFGLLLSEDSESTLRCCTADEFESMKKVSKRRPMYYIQSLLEDKDLGLTQEQREILLEDQTREQDPRNMHDWSHWSPRPVQRCQMQGRACWKSLSRKELLVPAKPTSSAAQGSSDAKSDESPPQGNSDAKSDDLPGLDTSSGDTSSGNANGYDNHDHTHAETTTDDEKVAKKDVGMY